MQPTGQAQGAGARRVQHPARAVAALRGTGDDHEFGRGLREIAESNAS